MRNFFITLMTVTSMLLNQVPLALAADEVKKPDCNVAQDRLKCITEQGNSTTTTETDIPDGTVSNLPMSGNTTTTTMFGSAGAAGSGAYAQAQEAKNQANNTMMLAMAMAAMFAMQCGPRNPTACMLAAAAAAAAMMANSKKNQAQQLMNTLGNSGATTSTTDGSTDNANSAELDKVRDSLARKGYKINDDGSFVAPNGATVDSGMSDQSLANAGLNQSDINGVRSGLDKMKKDIKDKLANQEGDVSGASLGIGDTAMSGAYGSKGGTTSETGKGNPSAGADRMGLDRNPAAWDGFYSQYGDSLLGVAQSDIFLMVEKRVEKERVGMGH